MRPASAPGPGDRKNRLWPKCRRIAKFWARKGVRQHTKYKPYQRAWGLAKIRYSRQYRAAQTAKFVQSLRDRGWAVASIAGYLKCSAGKVYRLLKAQAGNPCIWGIGLGQTAAMSAVAAYWPETGRLDAIAAFPNDPPLGARERFDGVKPGLYQNMADRAELLLLGDKVVPVGQLLNAAQRQLGYPDAIACDRWRLGELEDAMTDAALLAPVQARGMGFKDGSEDVRLFKTALLEGRVHPVRSLLLRSAVAETRLVQDPAGNAKIAKAGEGNRRHRGRDDPAVAAVQAVALDKLPTAPYHVRLAAHSRRVLKEKNHVQVTQKTAWP